MTTLPRAGSFGAAAAKAVRANPAEPAADNAAAPPSRARRVKSRCVMRNPFDGTLWRHVDRRVGARALAGDQNDHLLILGAVVMHLFAEVRDRAAGLDADGGVLVPLVAGADVPGAFDDRDEAVVGMKMRLGETSRLEAVHHHVEAGLGRIAEQDL